MALAFLVIPVVAIFGRVPPGDLVSALGTDAAKDAFVVTAKTNLISMMLIVVFGTPAAYWIASRDTRLRDVVVTLVELPLVLPPAVAGIGLLAAFGRLGLLGSTIDALGIDIAFTQTAVVLAVTFVASPFYVRTAVAAFESIDPTLPAAARTLGAGPARVFLRVALPLSAGGLGAGAALAFARGIGEFGATIMFAGSLAGNHADTLARDLRTVRSRLRRRPGDQRRPRRDQRNRPPLRQAPHAMALRLNFTHSLRTFDAYVELGAGEGETLALVGPSGAGKTTTLRVVAGLLRPDGGRVRVANETWLDTETGVDWPAERRRVGYLFQEYALFPHLDVAANIRFGAPRGEPVGDLLDRFRIAGLANARVSELSGGERQRVALARALARRPRVLLLDEPLSALDAHTKSTVRSELHELLRGLALPTVLVTHDFEDAAALADTIAVVVGGQIVQEGKATDLVARPADAFVASLTGASLLHGTARAGENGLTEVVLDDGSSAWSSDRVRGRVALAVHPWEVSLARAQPVDSAVNHLAGAITSIVPLGNRARVRVGELVGEISMSSLDRLGLREGEVVVASFKATAARLLPLA